MTDQFRPWIPARGAEPIARQTPGSQAASLLHRALNAGGAGLSAMARNLALRGATQGAESRSVGGAGVVQRAVKDLLAPPAATASPKVGDLTTPQVALIEAADTVAKKKTLLKALVPQIATALGMPATTVAALTVQYGAGSSLGLFQPWDGHPGGIFTLYEGAFASPALLYSTIRHELIHVEQVRTASAAVTAATDGAMYSSTAETTAARTDLGNFLGAVQEIETHAWELINATRTGASAVKIGRLSFAEDRKQAINGYWAKFKASLAKLTPAEKTKYQGYIDKATALYTEAKAYFPAPKPKMKAKTVTERRAAKVAAPAKPRGASARARKGAVLASGKSAGKGGMVKLKTAAAAAGTPPTAIIRAATRKLQAGPAAAGRRGRRGRGHGLGP